MRPRPALQLSSRRPTPTGRHGCSPKISRRLAPTASATTAVGIPPDRTTAAHPRSQLCRSGRRRSQVSFSAGVAGYSSDWRPSIWYPAQDLCGQPPQHRISPWCHESYPLHELPSHPPRSRTRTGRTRRTRRHRHKQRRLQQSCHRPGACFRLPWPGLHLTAELTSQIRPHRPRRCHIECYHGKQRAKTRRPL